MGVICEYDPFHRGHARQLELIRRELPDAYVICVMSGCFTQRGAPALFSPAFRALAALTAGADAVLELPCAFALRDAERFALGGVSLLQALGCVTHLCFGAEDGLQVLAPAARLLSDPDDEFQAELRRGLDAGLSHASARGQALARRMPEAARAAHKPNNILGICYLRALNKLGSDIKPMVVRREGDYHCEQLGREGADGVLLPVPVSYPSATAVRAAYLRGDIAAAESACGYTLPNIHAARDSANPRGGTNVRDGAPLLASINACVDTAHQPANESSARISVHLPDALDTLLINTLRTADPQALAALPDCSEGLHNRLASAARAATSREALLAALKTKRYSYARLSRLCAHALLGVTGDMLDAHPAPEYARLLGFRIRSAPLLKALKQGGLPILSRGADGNPHSPLVRLDIRAYELWALGARLPSGLWFRQPIEVYPSKETR